ncbi:MAG: lactate utilization protein [Lachnospiraceae bacterium]|nr:lactate utilization protein [Lachnospiraceae bacterium]
MTIKEQTFEKLSQELIKNLKKRNIDGYYFADSKSCVDAVLDMMPEKSSIAWGGSMTLKESGLMDALQSKDYTLIDRSAAKTPQESREIYAKTVLADYYLMSTNAMTIDGELINIDGNGNRVACLIQGPAHVFLIVGRNKVVSSVEGGIERVRNFASPPNAIRLNRNIPCGLTGFCHDCLSAECFCNQIVVTRRSGHTGRIKVFLINEDLGY